MAPVACASRLRIQMKQPLSVTIVTLNEEKNLTRALESVKWADDILVVDSGSTDATVSIAAAYGARVVKQKWLGYGAQKNFAQNLAKHDWVLNLDADEEVSPELVKEICEVISRARSLEKSDKYTAGFSMPRKTWYLGRWILHGGWYPNRIVRLVDRRYAKWSEPEVHEALLVQGETEMLHADLLHYTFHAIGDQVETNLCFSRLGYRDLLRKGAQASLLKLVLKPIGKFIETYILKKGFLDGVPGFIISVNAAHSIFLKYAYFFEPENQA